MSKIKMYATTDNGQGYCQEIGVFTDLNDMEVIVSLFEKGTVITFAEEFDEELAEDQTGSPFELLKERVEILERKVAELEIDRARCLNTCCLVIPKDAIGLTQEDCCNDCQVMPGDTHKITCKSRI